MDGHWWMDSVWEQQQTVTLTINLETAFSAILATILSVMDHVPQGPQVHARVSKEEHAQLQLKDS